MSYKQLDFQKRCQIYGLWRAGHNQTKYEKSFVNEYKKKFQQGEFAKQKEIAKATLPFIT